MAKDISQEQFKGKGLTWVQSFGFNNYAKDSTELMAAETCDGDICYNTWSSTWKQRLT